MMWEEDPAELLGLEEESPMDLSGSEDEEEEEPTESMNLGGEDEGEEDEESFDMSGFEEEEEPSELSMGSMGEEEGDEEEGGDSKLAVRVVADVPTDGVEAGSDEGCEQQTRPRAQGDEDDGCKIEE